MIRVQKVAIREFRGIRNLELALSNKNFAICGPNGTGKSGIVDALEFALTGNISRLSGAGTGDLSVKDHGPHVDSRSNPERAAVTLTVFIPSLNKTATIERTVKNAKHPKITPDDHAVKKALEHIQLHPEFALSRRELIRYVLAEPGKRSKEVQALLRLDELEALRATLTKITNSAERQMPVLENARKSAAEQLVRALDIPALVGDALLAAVNSRRETLGLPHLAVLEANTSVKDGLTVTATAKGGSRVPRPQALADLKDVAGKLASIAGETFKASAKAAADAITEFRSDPASSDGISHEALLKSALNLFDDRACPVCDTPWEPAEFRRVIGEKLEHFHALTKRREEMERQLTPVTDELSALASALALVSKYGPQLTPPVDVKAAQDHGGLLTRTVTTIKNFLPLLDTERALTETDFLPSALSLTIEALEGAVNALPEPTQQDAARDFLTVAQERLDMYRETSRQLKAGQKKAETARKVLDHFGTVTTAALDKIYRDVEEFFSGLYRAINHEDEGAFRAQLKPSLGKLGFDVDFYGRGYFPPGAYHSEGHQDGMGLCLYLALMRHLQGEHFTFAVLDDVLMSVDAGHRREVSKMLGEKFPNTQFIMTTHDEIWLRHMKTAGLIGQNGFTHFRTWHVDSGPTEWDDRDVWQELDDYLKANDVRSAAALLRHYLEHISKEICQRVRARVEFRGDAQFVLGDLLPNAIGAFRGHLKSGKAAAQSWAQTDIFDALTASETQFAAAVTASNVEQWQINAAVHYNEWAALQKSDFEPVALAFKALVAQFQCVDCGTFLYVSPDRGQAEVMRCGCSKISINFGKRKN